MMIVTKYCSTQGMNSFYKINRTMNSYNDLSNITMNSGSYSDNIVSKCKIDPENNSTNKSNRTNAKSLSHILLLNGTLFASTNEGSLIKSNMDFSGEIEEIEMSRRESDEVQKVFADPRTHWLVVSLSNGDNYIVNGNTFKARRLYDVNGSIGSMAIDSSYAIGTSILLGMRNGKLYELRIDLNGKERSCTLLYQFPNQASILSLFVHTIPDFESSEKRYVVLCTVSDPIFVYHFFGGPTLQKLFSDTIIMRDLSYTEFPGESLLLDTIVDCNYIESNHTIKFVVLCLTGIYTGMIFLSKTISRTADLVVEVKFIPFSDPSIFANLGAISAVVTEYHILVLSRSKILVFSLLSGNIIQELSLAKDVDGLARALTRDLLTHEIALYTDTSVHKIELNDEQRFLWSIYLKSSQFSGDEKGFNLALSHAKSDFQKVEVINEQAIFYKRRGLYDTAAGCFCKSNFRFHDSVLCLLGQSIHNLDRNVKKSTRTQSSNIHTLENTFTLSIYLASVSSTLPSHYKSQKCIISTWLIDLMLYEISYHELSRSQNIYESSEGLVAKLKDFLRSAKLYLDPITVSNLILGRNHRQLLLLYAQVVGDYERVVDIYTSQSRYIDIINILSDAPFEKVDTIIYKISPMLVEFEPESTFLMLSSKPKLKVVNVLATITRYCSLLDEQLNSTQSHPFPVNIDFEGNKVNFALKFIQETFQSILDLDHFDPVVSHILIPMLAKYDISETTLKPLLESLLVLSRRNRSIHSMDKEFILRQCRRWNRRKSCIIAYLLLGNEDRAIGEAISIDIQWAKTIAFETEDKMKSKSLLLKILKYYIILENDTSSALQLLHDSGGSLLMEDLLPWLPDFTEIDCFKTEICETLEVSGARIELLKNEMTELSESSESISKELENMKRRGYSADVAQRCSHCSEHLFHRQFYLFPCSHGFHSNCIVSKLSKLLPASKVQTIRVIEEQLATMQYRKGATDKNWTAQQEILQNELDGLIAADCPECGYLMIESLAVPLFSNETEEAKSWLI